MSTPETPQSIAPCAPARTPRATSSKGEHRPLVTCGICGERFARLGRHVRTSHGLTPAQYGRVFAHGTPQGSEDAPLSATSHPSAGSGVPGATLRELAAACAESPDFTARLASDVGAYLFGSGLRSSLALSLGAMLQTRAELAGSAAARLAAIDAELAQPWRLNQGGEAGAPTPTRDLVAMHQAASAELRDASDATLRAMRLAVAERKGERGELAGDAPLDAYRGDRDALPLPADIGPAERGIMLELVRRLADGARAQRGMIDATAARPVEPAASLRELAADFDAPEPE